MNGGQLPTNQLHDINWGTLDHASRAHRVCVSVFVGSCLATKVFIGNLLATRRGWVIIK